MNVTPTTSISLSYPPRPSGDFIYFIIISPVNTSITGSLTPPSSSSVMTSCSGIDFIYFAVFHDIGTDLCSVV